MFDINQFKERIKVWNDKHPNATKEEFLDYCEELIPVGKYHQYSWVLEQASMWFDNARRNTQNIKTSN